MRVEWPSFLLISLSLHFGAILGFLFFGGRFVASPAPASASPPESITLLLRSEPVQSHVLASSFVRPVGSKEQSPGHVAVFSKSPHASSAPPAPAALALRDRARASLRSLALSSASPSHLDSRSGIVFLLDISGSMYESYAGSSRLALGRQLLAQHIRELKDGTPFAVAVYGETSLASGPLVAANEASREAAIRFLDQEYDCGGGTNLPAGLTTAQQLQIGSILLVTDGDLNMTAAELLPRAQGILGAARQGPTLTILGLAPRQNTGDQRLLEELAQQQGGSLQVIEGESLTASLSR